MDAWITPTIMAASAGAKAGASLLGPSNKWKKINTRSDQQIGAQNQALQQAMQGLQNPYEGFQPIANQARQQFNSQTVPSIAERFTNLGGQGGQRSSAFQGSLGQAGAGLETDLAALQSQYGLQNRSQFLQQLQVGLEPNFENVFGPGSSGLGKLSQALGGLGDAGSGLGGYYGKKGMNQDSNKAFFDFLKQYQDATGGNSGGNAMPNNNSQSSIRDLFSPQSGQNRFNNYVKSGGSQLGSGFFNPMNQGY